MTSHTRPNEPYIEFWNDVLVNKFERYQDILMGGMCYHSETPLRQLQLDRGARVLDIGCGWGDTAMALAEKVGPAGSVHGIERCNAFLEQGRRNAQQSGLDNISFIEADVQAFPFLPEYDFCFSRFGMMFFSNPVAAMCNIYRALKPGGDLLFIAWRDLEENPWLSAGRETVLRYLPLPGSEAKICGPGPFSMSNPAVVSDQLASAGFTDISAEPIDGPVMAGVDLEQAVEFQLAIGPAGEIVREAGETAESLRPMIVKAMHETLAPSRDETGRVIMQSASWIYRARKPLEN
jgi:ubiquinone/menaquinone biosynthesis C-methylase UbiE